MQNTFCEKLIWIAMTPTIFQWVKKEYPQIELAEMKRKTKQLYREMLRRTPDIGKLSKNPLRVSLSGGIIWLSAYDAMEGQMSHEQFSDMVAATMNSPLIRKAFSSKNPFTAEYQHQKLEKDQISNSISDSEFNWITETIPGRSPDEYTINYHRCGLCALGKQERHEDLIPYMCQMDYISVEQMGGVLHRSGTIATGAKVCDFHIIKKGSEWDR